MVSQKCQYAIRAVFALAKRHGQGPVKISEIAEEQAIPTRFLEVILNQLKGAGFVVSRRGAEGGYLIARPPASVSVGEIVRFVEGPLVPIECMTGKSDGACPLHGTCVFMAMWERIAKATSDIYEQTSFQHLVDDEARMQKGVSYSI